MYDICIGNNLWSQNKGNERHQCCGRASWRGIAWGFKRSGSFVTVEV